MIEKDIEDIKSTIAFLNMKVDAILFLLLTKDIADFEKKNNISEECKKCSNFLKCFVENKFDCSLKSKSVSTN